MESNNNTQYGQTINLAELPQMVEICKEIGAPLLIVSEPGFGKTETIKRMKGFEKVFISAGTSEVEDIKGLVFNDGKTIKYWTPDWYQQLVDAKKPTICFIDELSAGSHSVRNALLTLLDGSRRIPHLPQVSDQVVFVAAMNPPETNINCVELALPTLNRFVIVSLDQSLHTNLTLIKNGYKMEHVTLKKNPGDFTQYVIASVSSADWGKEQNHQMLNPRALDRMVKIANTYGVEVANHYSIAVTGTVLLISQNTSGAIASALDMVFETNDLAPLSKFTDDVDTMVKVFMGVASEERSQMAKIIAKSKDKELASKILDIVEEAWGK